MDAPEIRYARSGDGTPIAFRTLGEGTPPLFLQPYTTFDSDDLFGTAVQLAARICDRAEPGQVLVSRVVADLCAGKKLQFRHHSDATLKGFGEPVALYEVGRDNVA
jgi:hypothetical protein